MKSQRLLSMLLAAAMVAGSMPVTVFAGRLDYEPEEAEVPEITETEEEKETSKPTVKETKPAEKETEPEVKETEPEVKETEPAKETEETKETEAPKAEETEETVKADEEKPAESEKADEVTPEETDKPVADAPVEIEKRAEETHKVTSKHATISNVAISKDGNLTWDSVAGAGTYEVHINEDVAYFDISCGTQIDLNKQINADIKCGYLKKTSNNTYKIKVVATAYNSGTQAEETIAESDELSYVYKTSASYVKVGTFSGVKMSGKNLVWNKVKNATYYEVYYDGKHTTTVNSYNIGSIIDDEITKRIIYKSCNDKYSVYLIAYDCDDVKLAEWDGYVTYKTSAAPAALPALTNVSISKEGILTWDAYSSASYYSARVVGANDYIFAYSTDGVSLAIDLKTSIFNEINNGFEEQSSYKIELYASDDNGQVAEFVLNYKYKEANTLSVKGKTVKAKKSKAKKKNQSFKRSKVLTIKKAVGKLTYAKVSGNAKITINASTGKLTVKKKIKKGTYKVRIAVKAAGNTIYARITKIVTVKVKVK